ncbi:MAG: tail fiber domain-containing protein [Vicinamibacterales bacterium]
MSLRPLRALCSTVFCLACAALAAAQPIVQTSVPQVIRLDGRLPSNAPPGATVESLTLAIYDSDSATTPLFEETQDVRLGADGSYSVFLGASRAEGLPASVFAGTGVRWLGIRVARTGDEQRRVPLASVPYALRAADADSLGGYPPSAFFRVPGAAKTGGTAAGSAADRPLAPLVSSGTANYLGKFTNSIDLTSSVLFENGGRIGLGTTTPLDFIHSAFTDASGSLTGLAVQNLSGAASAYSGMLFYDQNGALGQFQGFNNSTHEYRINNIASGGTINFMIGSASRFLVRNDGDITVQGGFRRGANWLLHTQRGGGFNTGVGESAMGSPSLSGSENTAVGYNVLNGTGGVGNVGVGTNVLESNTGGSTNTAIGWRALRSATGSNNIAIGSLAGSAKVTGNHNIYIGNDVANDSFNTESNTIRIGGLQQDKLFVRGVQGVTTGQANAVAVLVDGNGQLGTINSSRRYKEDIQDMGEASSGLMKLRPVTYRYSKPYADGSKPIDYGLIAEEVEQVYPDLVVHLENGDVQTVQYQKINAMLLNEVQKQHRQIGEQQQELDTLKARLAALEKLLAGDKR